MATPSERPVGLVAAALNLVWAVYVAAALTLASGLAAWRLMTENAQLDQRDAAMASTRQE